MVFAELDTVESDPALLSEDERARAARFVFESPRRQYVATRTILRRLLGAFTGAPAATLRFAYGPGGKPSLADATGPRFNVSHSGAAALYAFALDREVGVDVEPLGRQPDALALARTVFTDRELAELHALPADRVSERFLTIWTRKEAYSKALALGLALPFSRVDVSTGRAVHVDGGIPLGATDWRIVDLRPDGHVAAVVAGGSAWELRCWRWPAAGGSGV